MYGYPGVIILGQRAALGGPSPYTCGTGRSPQVVSVRIGMDYTTPSRCLEVWRTGRCEEPSPSVPPTFGITSIVSKHGVLTLGVTGFYFPF